MLSLFSKPKDKIILPDSQLTAIKDVFLVATANQNILTSTLKYFIMLTDALPFALWIKDKNDRYIFANKKLRHDLFEGKDLPHIMSKSDAELTDGKSLEQSCDLSCIPKEPEKLPLIANYLEDHSRICNLTDIITRSYNKECAFIEYVEDKVLLVRKSPLHENDEEIGTFGYYIDLTHDRAFLENVIDDLAGKDKIFKIDNTNSYYLHESVKCDFLTRNFL